MYRSPWVPSSCTCSRMAVRSLVFRSTDPQPALSRSTLTSRMTSVSWAASPEPTFGALVVGLRVGVFDGVGFLVAGLVAVLLGLGAGEEGAADEGGGNDGVAAPEPGTPPPAPGARAATAAPG